MASRISMTFFDDFQDTFGRPQKEQVIGWNQIAGSKMQSCSAACDQVLRGAPPFLWRFWVNFCVPIFYPTAKCWTFQPVGLPRIFRKKVGWMWCLPWMKRRENVFGTHCLRWRIEVRWNVGPPSKPVGFLYPRIQKKSSLLILVKVVALHNLVYMMIYSCI